MLGENDVTLVYKLLDSLTDSLRKLTTNYELLVRSGDANASKAGELDKAIVTIKAELDEVNKIVTALNNSISSGVSALSAWVDRIEMVNRKIENLAKALETHDGSVSKELQGVKGDIKHIDQHCDDGSKAFGAMETKLSEMDKVNATVEGLKASLVPLLTLSSNLSKPLTIVLVIYIFLATLMAFWNVMGWAGEKLDRVMGKDKTVVVTNYVNMATQPTNTAQPKAVP